MTPLEITLQVLSILVSLATGAWLGKSSCHLAVELDTSEDRKGCFPWSRMKSVEWAKSKSQDSVRSAP
jgi:hypothetical protein